MFNYYANVANDFISTFLYERKLSASEYKTSQQYIYESQFGISSFKLFLITRVILVASSDLTHFLIFINLFSFSANDKRRGGKVDRTKEVDRKGKATIAC